MDRRTTVIVLVLVAIGALGVLFVASRPEAPQEKKEKEAGLDERVVDIEVAGDTMTPDEITLDEDDVAILMITADHQIVFDIPDYELGQAIPPDEPTEFPFEAVLAGRFEIVDALTETQLGTLIVEPRQEEEEKEEEA